MEGIRRTEMNNVEDLLEIKKEEGRGVGGIGDKGRDRGGTE